MSKKGKKKQTAVDLLFEGTLGLTLQLENGRISHRNWELQMVELFKQAKAMEEEQHQITFDMGYEEHIVETWGEEDPKGFKDYFTETYKS
jgi:hypothetical protein